MLELVLLKYTLFFLDFPPKIPSSPVAPGFTLFPPLDLVQPFPSWVHKEGGSGILPLGWSHVVEVEGDEDEVAAEVAVEVP